ncbi:uncharacterized protein LOC129591771 [Paramacrobiotus metropolitanus]|uniref:uncharacterized protein LOC129591771 n=1 Tax=Paramacrobiotus metropolitanus TaxID=2943436 RepID=UPI00244565D6|nr:uncharacterized protein LOC129591771 [Paramacrobiotus metropolitanus]
MPISCRFLLLFLCSLFYSSHGQMNYAAIPAQGYGSQLQSPFLSTGNTFQPQLTGQASGLQPSLYTGGGYAPASFQSVPGSFGQMQPQLGTMGMQPALGMGYPQQTVNMGFPTLTARQLQTGDMTNTNAATGANQVPTASVAGNIPNQNAMTTAGMQNPNQLQTPMAAQSQAVPMILQPSGNIVQPMTTGMTGYSPYAGAGNMMTLPAQASGLGATFPGYTNTLMQG